MSNGQQDTQPLHRRSDGVSIVASARLHMGFFDLNGNLGRRFGSIGVSLQTPVTSLRAYRDHAFSAEGPGAARALKIARRIAEALQLQGGLHIDLEQAIPEHAGLGSGTQMSLAVGEAISRLYHLNLELRDIALMTARGARSGIGLGTFATGGMVVDGGRRAGTDIPPVIARADFPSEWPILLVMEQSATGVHGDDEIQAFRTLPEFPADSAAELCRYVLMQALPALAERDLPAFGHAIRELQHRTGDYFAPAQGGRYASKRVAQVLDVLDKSGISCLGQSSWGPTGFAIFADESAARDAFLSLQSQFSGAGLDFILTRSNNAGAVISAC